MQPCPGSFFNKQTSTHNREKKAMSYLVFVQVSMESLRIYITTYLYKIYAFMKNDF